MKPLLILSLLSLAPVAMATPVRKRVAWEYATLDFSAYLYRSDGLKGADLFLPERKPIFLQADNYNKPAFSNYLLNRLGSQGWELVAISAHGGTERKYIFKRQK